MNDMFFLLVSAFWNGCITWMLTSVWTSRETMRNCSSNTEVLCESGGRWFSGLRAAELLRWRNWRIGENCH